MAVAQRRDRHRRRSVHLVTRHDVSPLVIPGGF
jgi:hypothetical protein